MRIRAVEENFSLRWKRALVTVKVASFVVAFALAICAFNEFVAQRELAKPTRHQRPITLTETPTPNRAASAEKQNMSSTRETAERVKPLPTPQPSLPRPTPQLAKPTRHQRPITLTETPTPNRAASAEKQNMSSTRETAERVKPLPTPQPSLARPTPQSTTWPDDRRGSNVIEGVFARSMFPVAANVRSEVTDFSILEAEGWRGSVLANTGPNLGAHLRRRQPGWEKLTHAVVLIAGGHREYLHFAISTTENIRANGYTGDIFVYLQVEVPDVDGCVASHLRRMGVKVLPFDQLMPNFDHPKNRNRSPAWFKLGLLWNKRMREYDRIFFFDTDQFININVEDVILRYIPENVTIAICGQECVRSSLIGVDANCDWECARTNQRFRRPRPVEVCDNMFVDVNRHKLVATNRSHLFWSHFPRKSIAYISGVWLLDNTKLPSITETRDAANSLFVNLDPAWQSFGDQGFFANYFYDNSAILPECHLANPKAWDHVFHSGVIGAVKGHGVHGPRFKKFYKDATGLTDICRGISFDGEIYQPENRTRRNYQIVVEAPSVDSEAIKSNYFVQNSNTSQRAYPAKHRAKKGE